jgi:hypothetical protein
MLVSSQPQDYLLIFKAEDDLDCVAAPHNLQSKCHKTPLSASQKRKPSLYGGFFVLKLKCFATKTGHFVPAAELGVWDQFRIFLSPASA